VNKNKAAGLVSDKAAAWLESVPLWELGFPAGEFSSKDWARLEQAKNRVVIRLLKMHNY
jgi:hypothetical protein